MVAGTRRLGVVVLNWNGLPYLGPCLDSLAASDHPDCFVVVVDNASADGSVEWLRARKDVDQDIELVELDENLRFAGGNNEGARRAIERGAEDLLILNNDTTVRPDTLRRISEAMQVGNFDLAGPRIVFADSPRRIWYGGGVFRPQLAFVGHRAIRKGVDEGADPAGPTDWVTGCALAIRADLWQELGGLDPSFYIYSEDVDLCLRARGRGARIGYAPDALVFHAVSASVGGQDSVFKAYHRTRARRKLMRRHGKGALWPFFLLVQDLAWAGLRLLRGRFAATRGVAQAITEPDTAPVRYTADSLGHGS